MRQIIFPNWLVWIDKHLKWLSIPKLPLFLTLIQVLGFFLVMGKPAIKEQLILIPKAVFYGEFWRIFTFIAIPLTDHIQIVDHILLVFVLWFFYSIMVWLEEAWGSTLLTVYFLVAWFSTVLASILLGKEINTFFYIGFSFFFALATIFPNKEIHLFFILPIAFKWIAAFVLAVLFIVPLFLASYNALFYLSLVFANYLLFFGKDYWLLFKKELDKRRKS